MWLVTSVLKPSGVGPDLAAALGRCRSALLAVGVFSGAINLLALTGSIYMMQIYDRVLPAHSVPTLVGLTLLMLLLYAAFGVFDHLRTRLLSRIGVSIDRSLRERVAACLLLLPLRTANKGDGQQPVRDLDQIRSFMSGVGPTALFDLPWLPVYVVLAFLLHPWLGLLSLAGAFVLTVLMYSTETRARRPTLEAASAGVARNELGEAMSRNAEAVRALGMSAALARRWSRLGERQLTATIAATDVAGRYAAVSKALRMALQSFVLGLGAYLVIRDQATAGTIVAASVLVSRGLAPIEVAISNWRGFMAARQGASRLARLLELVPRGAQPMPLPAPSRRLDVEGLWVAAPGTQAPILRDVSFGLVAGDGLGLIGPAAAGKSTLARALAGVWHPQRGTIRLDGAALEQWAPDALGRWIGYLPQDIELFAGTVAQNIGRFDPAAEGDRIITAANAAGVHEMILRLPNGYETELGDHGSRLSAGQRQRVALARALYGEPFLVVLDEPNSNLDAEGDAALAKAIGGVCKRGGIVVVIAHRPSAILGLEKLMVLGSGRIHAFGSRDDLKRPAGQVAVPASGARLKVVSEFPQET